MPSKVHKIEIMKIYLLLGIVFLSFSCSSTRIPTKKIVKINTPESLSDRDAPKVLIGTNRVKTFADKRYAYFGNKTDLDAPLKHIQVCPTKTVWNIKEYSSFEDIAQTLSPTKNIIVFVHGDGKLFSEVVERSLMLKELYDANIISFDYPSEDPKISPGFRNFFNSVKNVDASIPQFKIFLKNIETYIHRSPRFKDIKKTILFHSLGGYVYEKAVKNNVFNTLSPNLFDNILLNAPAVAQKNHAIWLEKSPLKGRTYITSNNHDFTLNGAIFITFKKMLGVGTDGPLARNAHYIDFSDIYLFEHNYFLMTPPAGKAVAKWLYDNILHGKSIDLSDRNHFQKRESLNIFNIIEP